MRVKEHKSRQSVQEEQRVFVAVSTDESLAGVGFIVGRECPRKTERFYQRTLLTLITESDIFSARVKFVAVSSLGTVIRCTAKKPIFLQ